MTKVTPGKQTQSSEQDANQDRRKHYEMQKASCKEGQGRRLMDSLKLRLLVSDDDRRRPWPDTRPMILRTLWGRP